ncbi:uncharacterized protein LOC128395018 [Panonychus citri]|uniref:uncharacterized protein LOC128395018 n=1 Tax=Panonychus citri TaxID=50023 RepID=UPI002306DDA5|nr:uncharacterized protein LOC128395018 [Panonychus citri]
MDSTEPEPVRLTWKEKLELIKLLRIDIYMMLFFISFSISGVSLNQLVEDKICLNELNLNQSICLNLEHTDADQEEAKNYVLSTAAVFKNYQTIISTVPGMFLSLFIGYWIDTYPSHLKYILAAPALGGTIGSLIVIYNCLHFKLDFMFMLISDLIRGLSGGFATIYTGVYTYITRKTPAKFRAIRFAILEFFSFIATPISLYLGGYILTTDPWLDNQPRNYISVFLVSAICSTLAFFWVLIFVRDADSNGPESTLSDTKPKILIINDESSFSGSIDQETIDQPDRTITDSVITQNSLPQKGCFGNFCHVFADIFNITNVINMFRTCTRKRENGLRCRIWHSMLMCSVALLSYMGDSAIGFPFAQKVYHWDAKYYSNVSSVIILIPSLATSVLIPILIKRFHFTDTSLGIIGVISMIAGMIIRGGFLTSTAYFVATIAGMFSGLMPISIRAFLSRMISFDEIGQVFSLLSAIESCAPAISSLFYSTVFKLTISTYPGMVYLLAAILLFYPFTVMLWLDLTKASWYDANKTTKTDQSDDENQSDLQIVQSSQRENESLYAIDNDLEQLIDN